VTSGEPAGDRCQVNRAGSGGREVVFGVELVQCGEDGLRGRSTSIVEYLFDHRPLVLPSHRGEQGLEGLGARLVVRGDRLGCHVDQCQE
jgi:hypothetical protein